MKLLQGIQLHELILMILGFILGLTLIFIFLYTALKTKPNLKLLYGFIAPLVMIGYPSIKSLEFGKDVIRIDKLVKNVDANPTDTVAQRELVNNLGQLPASRCKTSVDAMTTIANAQASLGLLDSAKVTIQKALELDENSEKANASNRQIKEKWNMQKDLEGRIYRLEDNLREIEKRPNDQKLHDSLAVNLQNLNQRVQFAPVHLENAQIILIAKASAIAGQKAQAEQITNDVLKVSPNNGEANKLKQQMENKVFERRYRNDRLGARNQEKVSKKIQENVAKMRQKVENAPAAVPSPAPVFEDTAQLRVRFIPRSVLVVKKWNLKD